MKKNRVVVQFWCSYSTVALNVLVSTVSTNRSLYRIFVLYLLLQKRMICIENIYKINNK